MYSDRPGNELAPEACVEIINACAFAETLDPREGMQQILAFTPPPSTNLNGQIRHTKTGYYYVHVDTKLYYSPDQAGTWTEIVRSGATALPDTVSNIRELGDSILVFATNGIFRVDLALGHYWRTNVEPATNNITGGNSLGHHRRYVHTMSRLRDADGGPILWSNSTNYIQDRADLVIDQETGACALDDNDIDYKEVYTDREAGSKTTTYGTLVTWTVTATTGLTGSCFFNWTYTGTVYTIQYVVAATATLPDIAAAIQTAMRAKISDKAFCTYSLATTKFTIGVATPMATTDYLASPVAVSGWTDVSATLTGTLFTGATLVTAYYYSQPSIIGYQPWSDWKALTHYSFFGTKSLYKETNGIVTGSPSSYAWMYDIPVMRAGWGSASITTLSCDSTNGMALQAGADVGQWVTFIDSSDSSAEQHQISNVAAFGKTVTYLVSGGFGNTQCFVGAKWGCRFDSTAGDATVATWLETWKSTGAAAGAYTPSKADQTVAVGDPLFCSDGRVYYITAKTDNKHFKIDTTATLTNILAGFTPKGSTETSKGNNISDYIDDSVISARIGTLGLRSRFFTAMSDTDVGAVSNGFVVIGYDNKIAYNNIGSDQQYIIGNCHPSYQVEALNGDVHAVTINQNIISVFTNYATYTTQTNLDISVTDPNGAVVYTLPKPVLADMYIGTTARQHVCEYERDAVIVLCQDHGIRTWNGYQYSDNLILNKITKKLKACSKLLVCYDDKYGVLVFGSTNGTTYDKIYTVGIKEDRYTGASEFQNLPVPDLDVQPINVSTRALWFPDGAVVGRWIDNAAVTWLEDSLIDVPDSTAPTVGYEIPWSFQTGDDKGTDQAHTIRHLESHLYVSGAGTNQEVPSAVTIQARIYNDIGRLVTTNVELKSNPHYIGDINFDKRIEGHRIRFGFSFDKANLVVNGMSTYYESRDKASSIASRTTTEHDYQTALSAPVFGITRTGALLNMADGKLLGGSGSLMLGPDGRYSGWIVSGADGTCSEALTGAWMVSAWLPDSTGPYDIIKTGDATAAWSANRITVSTARWDRTASTWSHVLIAKAADGTCACYVDGTAQTPVGSAVVATTLAIGTTATVTDSTLADLRVIDGTYTASVWSYYRSDVLAGGDKVLPA
jgi:hypothetical protein